MIVLGKRYQCILLLQYLSWWTRTQIGERRLRSKSEQIFYGEGKVGDGSEDGVTAEIGAGAEEGKI